MLKGFKEALSFFGDGHFPYPLLYSPELVVTNELCTELTNRFQHLIGVLRWSIEIGSIEIVTEASFLYQHLC